MDMINIELMQDFSEVVHYEQAELPLSITASNLSNYPNMSAHATGMKTSNGFIQQRENGYSYKNQDCRFFCILFHPSLFCNNQVLLCFSPGTI